MINLAKERKISVENIKSLNKLFDKTSMSFVSILGPIYRSENYGIEGYTIKIINLKENKVKYHLVPGMYGEMYALCYGDIDKDVYHEGHIKNFKKELDNGWEEEDAYLFRKMKNVVKTIVLDEIGI